MKYRDITIYNNMSVYSINELKEIYKTEKDNNNIKSARYVVNFYNQFMDEFNTLEKAVNYIYDDYNNNKDEFYFELNAYSIEFELYTKDNNIKYIYEYNISIDDDIITSVK